MIEPASSSMPVGTWAKHNTVEVVRHNKLHGEEQNDYINILKQNISYL